MPKPDPREFGEDIVWVARDRPAGVTLEQVAADFGVHPMTFVEVDAQSRCQDGIKPGATSGQLAELREAKRRVRTLKMENEVPRRAAAYLSQANLPGSPGK